MYVDTYRCSCRHSCTNIHSSNNISSFSVKDEKKKLEADLESCKKQGQDFIQYVMNDMKKRKEKLINERDFYVAKYEADCKKMSQTLKEGIVKAERALKKLDE